MPDMCNTRQSTFYRSRLSSLPQIFVKLNSSDRNIPFAVVGEGPFLLQTLLVMLVMLSMLDRVREDHLTIIAMFPRSYLPL